MIFQYKDSKIFYRFFDKNSDAVNVYLHGWGADYKSLLFCKDSITCSSLFVDFPPFGKSDKNIQDWSIFTYATMLISLCEFLNLKKVNLIGHSFGGRVAILMSVFCKSKVNKLVLVDSAGLKPRRKLSYYIKILRYKIRKRLHLDTSNFGSCDYQSCTKQIQKIFVSVVNTHLDDFLPRIAAKTLIIFGEKDKTTPVYMAKKFKRKIATSEMVIIPNAGHFCFIDKRHIFIRHLKNFLTEEE